MDADLPPIAELKSKRCDFCQELIHHKATRCRHCMSWLSSKSVLDGEGWRIETELFIDPTSEFLEKRERVWVIFEDEFLKSRLRYWLNDNVTFLQKEARVPLHSLFTLMDKFRELSSVYVRANANSARTKLLRPLVEYLEKQFAAEIARFEACKRDGVISFDMLQHLFCRGAKVLVDVDGGVIGSEVTSQKYLHRESGVFFEIQCDVIKSAGVALFIQKHKAYIGHFTGAKQLNSLPIRPLEMTGQLDGLIARGKQFFKVAMGCHHMEYDGQVSQYVEDVYVHFKANGRVMIDAVSFNKMMPGYKTFLDSDLDMGDGNTVLEVPLENSGSFATSDPDILMKTWPTIGGFSFYAKKWAEIRIDSLRTIRYHDRAFDDLVMAVDVKQMIRAIVTQRAATVGDIISGKGAGCVFLLHGPPGVGKTLTAESVAELLHRPLYTITVGELGTSVQSLEDKLRSILDIAAAWDAVLLLDEADVYLEKRSSSVDVERNGLVCVFLRLLEYYQGVLFLTTNHVRHFDDAIFSRVSVALEFKPLNVRSRSQIWRNMLRLVGIARESEAKDNATAVDIQKLSSYTINGRQIRTSLQISQALARSESRSAPSQADIERAVQLLTSQETNLTRPSTFWVAFTCLSIAVGWKRQEP